MKDKAKSKQKANNMIAMKQPNGKFTVELTGDEIAVVVCALTESLVQGTRVHADLLSPAIRTEPKEIGQTILVGVYK